MKETMQRVLCANCGWESRRKTGNTVVCKQCGSVATFVIHENATKQTRSAK